jgi:hypothetical protein
MDHDQFLSWVVDEILKDADKRQIKEAHEETTRRFVLPKDSIIGYHSFGIIDFVMRLVHDMHQIHGIKWSHTHPQFVINDFACVVNKQEKINDMKAVAKRIPMLQDPYKLTKMARVIDSKWKQFDAQMNKQIPQHKRYFRISLIAMYAHYIGKQLPGDDAYPTLTRRVTGCKESFLPGITRRAGLKATGILMDTAMEITMRDFAEAKTRFKTR